VPVGAYCVDTQPNKALFFIGQDLLRGRSECATYGQLIGSKGKWRITASSTSRPTSSPQGLRRPGQGGPTRDTIVARPKPRTGGAHALADHRLHDGKPDLAGVYCNRGRPHRRRAGAEGHGQAGKIKVWPTTAAPDPEYIKDVHPGRHRPEPYAEGRTPSCASSTT